MRPTTDALSQAFLVIIFVGVASALLILPPNRVVHSDGTIVTIEGTSTPRKEAFGMARSSKTGESSVRSPTRLSYMNEFTSTCMPALLPMFFAANFFYAYQGAVNA